MLQLATQSTQVPLNSRPVDNPGCRAAPAPSSTIHRSCFAPAWRSPLQFAISTIGSSAGFFGASYMIVNEAGYMIVNELGLTRAGCGANAHSRQPCGADPSSSRSPTRARGILVSPRLCQEGTNSDTHAFAEHKIISDGVQGRPLMSDFPLRIRICTSAHRWTDPNGGQNVVRPIARLSKEA
jgi:hypothetical protein